MRLVKGHRVKTAEPPMDLGCEACGKSFTARAATVRYLRKVRGEHAFRFCSVQCFWDGTTGLLSDDTSRECIGCGEVKPKTLEYFEKHRRGRDMLHPRCRECEAKRAKEKRDALRLRVFEYYSDGDVCCACCGESSMCFLSLDHVNNDGAEHRRKLTGGKSRGGNLQVFYWILRNDFPPGFQVLCHNCNMAKGIYGECPHETMRNKRARLSA